MAITQVCNFDSRHTPFHRLPLPRLTVDELLQNLQGLWRCGHLATHRAVGRERAQHGTHLGRAAQPEICGEGEGER